MKPALRLYARNGSTIAADDADGRLHMACRLAGARMAQP